MLVNLDRCIGCHSCEIACKQENKVPEGTKRIEVKQIGPATLNGKTRMDYIPLMNNGCTLCAHIVKVGRGTACEESCPNDALNLCDDAEALLLLHNSRRHQICRAL